MAQGFGILAKIFFLCLLCLNVNANEELVKLQGLDASWVMPLGDYSATRYSTLSKINRDNVHQLVPAWTFATGALRGHGGGPLVIDNIMYVHTPFPNKVYALDLKNNHSVLWKYEPQQADDIAKKMRWDTVNNGLAFGEGKIFLYQADTTLVALDAKTGKELWKQENGDTTYGATATSSPLVVNNKVIVGIDGGTYGVRGYLTAYNIETGKREWRAYSVGPDTDILVDVERTMVNGKPIGINSSLSSWNDDQWKHGGGTTGGWMSFDPELNLIYYGTGSPGTLNPLQRKGDNRWSSAIIARDADSGVARWMYQMTPHDAWHFDGNNEMILVDVEHQGESTKAIVHFDQNGFAYTINRETGELLAAEKYEPQANWATEIDKKTGKPKIVALYSPDENGQDVTTKNICPAVIGAKYLQPASFSSLTGLFYVPTNNVCMHYEPYKVRHVPGQPFIGASVSMFAPEGSSNLGKFIAWDANKNTIVWSKDELFSVWSGALATAGGIVFYGTLEGYLKAVDQKTGKELWKHKTESGIIGNVTTYEHDGEQYIAVLSGIGSWAGLALTEPGLTGYSDGLGAVGLYKNLREYTQLGGELIVYKLGSAAS